MRDKPDIYKALFWDVAEEVMDYRKNYRLVIARVLERGTNEELDEIVRFYGRDKIIHALQHDIAFLFAHAIDRAVSYFRIDIESVWAYQRRREMPNPFL